MLKYSEFLAENVQRSKAIIAKKIKDYETLMAQRMRDYETLKERLTRDNTLGYLGKLTELLFGDEPLADLTAAYERMLALRRANVRVNIDDMKSLEEIQDSLEEKERDVRVKQVLSRVPPAQRQWFTGDSMTKSDLNLLDGMSRVNSAPFMRKVSQYRDKQTMIRMANVFMKSAGSPADRAHFRGLAGKGLKVVHEDDRVIVFHTEKVEDLLKVGGDTAWCIKNPSTFQRYTSDGATQYVLVDFDKDRWDPLFKVGFTLSTDGGVKFAHDVLDATCVSHLSDLLGQSGVDPVALVRSTRGQWTPPNMATAGLGNILKWLQENGITADEAPSLIKSLLGRPGMSDAILRFTKYNTVWTVLGILFAPLARERYLTTEDLDALVPARMITKAARSALVRILREARGPHGNIMLPDMEKLDIAKLYEDPKISPYLHLIDHDVFTNNQWGSRSDLAWSVWCLMCILEEENLRDYPYLADQMRRLIGLAEEAKRPVLMAAWERAVNGVVPEFDQISAQIEAAGAKNWSTNILEELGVQRPFDESEVLAKWGRLKKEMILTGPEVTVSKFDHGKFPEMVLWLRKKGVRANAVIDSEEVLRVLSDLAVWDSGMPDAPSAPRYRSRRSYSRLPDPLDSREVRDRIVRTRKRRFDWRPDTKFPFTIVIDGVTYTIVKEGEAG